MIIVHNNQTGVVNVDEVKSRGGKREGAGRKKLEVSRNKFIIYVTDQEQTAIKNMIANMRNDLSTPNSNVTYSQIELNAIQSKYDIEISTLHSDINHYINEYSVLKSSCKNEISTLESKYQNEINTLKSKHAEEIKAHESKYSKNRPIEQRNG